MPYFEQESLRARDLLAWAMERFGARFAISTSFQQEGMVLVDMAARIDRRVRVFTLDTGRLPAETHQMIAAVEQRYGIAVERILPDVREVDTMVGRHGADLFYRDAPSRLLCCEIRKVRPMRRVLAGLDAYAAGLRRSQSETRADVPRVDDSARCLKLSPLADWSREDVAEYIAAHEVPVHPLYAKGYTSIGCDPCTRAVEPGEHERAGRWWWEQDAAKECGLHVGPDGRMRRTLDVMLEEIVAT